MRYVTMVAFALAAAFGCEKSICDDDPSHPACLQPGDGEPLPVLEAGATADGTTPDGARDGSDATATPGDAGPTNGDGSPVPGDGATHDATPIPDDSSTPDGDADPGHDARPPNDAGAHDSATPDHDADRPPQDASQPVDAAEPPRPDAGPPPGTPFRVIYTPPPPNADLDMVQMHLACINATGQAIVGDRHGDPIEVEADNVGNERLVFFGEVPAGQQIGRCYNNLYDEARDLWVLRCDGPDSPVCELIAEGAFELQIGEGEPSPCEGTTRINNLNWWECLPPPAP